MHKINVHLKVIPGDLGVAVLHAWENNEETERETLAIGLHGGFSLSTHQYKYLNKEHPASYHVLSSHNGTEIHTLLCS